MSQRTTAGGRRRLSRTPVKATVDRRELVEAIGVVAGILVVTGILIWGMRPGGILGRQPRVVLWLIILAGVVAISARLLVSAGRRFHDRPRIGWGIVVAITGVVGLVLALVWPSGLIVRSEDPAVFVPDTEQLPFEAPDDLAPAPGDLPVDSTPETTPENADEATSDVPSDPTSETSQPTPEG